MTIGLPLPPYFVQRYEGWKATKFVENKVWYKHLAEDGQHPRAMVISCCDSRVNATAFFGPDPRELFIHRNTSNLVPPLKPDGVHHCTSAALEYAVCTLKVPHLIILGHSSCGGVNGCYRMCHGDAPELEKQSSFVGRWMDILRPAYERIVGTGSEEQQIAALEREGIVESLHNLMGFPFVREAVEAPPLSIHGLWNDIGDGSLFYYNGRDFEPVSKTV